jgi:hypothetical protein
MPRRVRAKRHVDLRAAWIDLRDQLRHLEERLVGYRGTHGETTLAFSPMPFDASLLPGLLRQARKLAGWFGFRGVVRRTGGRGWWKHRAPTPVDSLTPAVCFASIVPYNRACACGRTRVSQASGLWPAPMQP